MDDQPIQFRDGASYDTMMGGWSRSVGALFLDWLKPPPQADWIDVGCGSGAFTELVLELCSPRDVLGIDPSEAQLRFARSRLAGSESRFEIGDVMTLEAGDASRDVAVAALVVHFMPDPARGIAEMARVVRPGGIVGAYAWDLTGGGFPYEAIHSSMRALGLRAPEPPHPEAAETAELQRLWQTAGLVSLAQRQFKVTRTFRDFDHYWEIATSSPRIAAGLASVGPDELGRLRGHVRESLQEEGGEITPSACANAIVGRVPA